LLVWLMISDNGFGHASAVNLIDLAMIHSSSIETRVSFT
jgi:hypothetical protein